MSLRWRGMSKPSKAAAPAITADSHQRVANVNRVGLERNARNRLQSRIVWPNRLVNDCYLDHFAAACCGGRRGVQHHGFL